MEPPLQFDALRILSEATAWSERNESVSIFEQLPEGLRAHMAHRRYWSRTNTSTQSRERISVVKCLRHSTSGCKYPRTNLPSFPGSSVCFIPRVYYDAQLRRGVPASHKIYGIPQTINSANYAYFLAYQELFTLRSGIDVHEQAEGQDGKKRLIPFRELDRIVTAELLSLHRGQGLELLWRDSLQCPTEEEYVAMVNNKTGGLFRVAVKLMMACSTANIHVDYVTLVNLFGIYYQIRDDYMNLQSTEYAENKGFAEDLTEGKFSFPIVHAVRADTSNRQVLNVLQKRPSTPTLKLHTVLYLRQHTKSFDYTIGVLRSLEKQIRDEITRLGGNQGLEKIIDALHVE